MDRGALVLDISFDLLSSVPRRVLLLITGLVLAGCTGSSSPSGDDGGALGGSDAARVEVPDVSGSDGAEAESDVEDAGLEATLADANDDPGFDDARDARDCEVTDQEPVAGSEAEPGEVVTITIDCSQVDWESQDGSQWEDFSDAYSTGFDDGCQSLFDQSPNGSLYEDDIEYTVNDCQSENPGDASDGSDVPQEVPDDPEAAGAELGELDGCQSLFENDGVVSLNYGADSYTEDDCPIDSASPPAGAPVSPRSSSQGRGASTRVAGESCSGKDANGKRITLKVNAGKINCAGAVTLLNDWVRRAPTEGTGSGGALKLYGWECIGATATQAPKIGTCQRTGAHAAKFTASLSGSP